MEETNTPNQEESQEEETQNEKTGETCTACNGTGLENNSKLCDECEGSGTV